MNLPGWWRWREHIGRRPALPTVLGRARLRCRARCAMLVLEVKPLSVLSRPQNEWDEFLDDEARRRTRSPVAKLLWLIIPAAVVIIAFVCFRYLA